MGAGGRGGAGCGGEAVEGGVSLDASSAALLLLERAGDCVPFGRKPNPSAPKLPCPLAACDDGMRHTCQPELGLFLVYQQKQHIHTQAAVMRKFAATKC